MAEPKHIAAKSRENLRSIWNTSLVFITLILLTALMVFAVKGMVTGSFLTAEQVESPVSK